MNDIKRMVEQAILSQARADAIIARKLARAMDYEAAYRWLTADFIGRGQVLG